jgi:hypothetical protein
MDTLPEMFFRGLGEMVARLSGPLNFRLIVMPIVVSVLAIRAGLRDARAGHPPFLLGVLARPRERRDLFRSAIRDAGKVFVMAVILDTGYQVYVLGTVYPVQVLIIAVACAIVPYVLVRTLTLRVVRAVRPRATSDRARE